MYYKSIMMLKETRIFCSSFFLFYVEVKKVILRVQIGSKYARI